MLPNTVTYRTVAAFTFGLPLLLFVLVVVISYIYIDPSQQIGNASNAQSTSYPDLPELHRVAAGVTAWSMPTCASPCQDPPEWRECVPMLAVSLYYFDPKSADCLPRDTLPKGCLNGSNGFEDLQQCQQACAIHPHQSEQNEQKKTGDTSYEIRQRSQRRSRPLTTGRALVLNGKNIQNHWFTDTDPVAQQVPQGPKDNPASSNELPPKRCRTVTLDECDATALKASVVYDPATDTCASWQYSKGCYRNKNIFFTRAECQEGCSRTSSAKLPNADDCVNPIVGEACDDRLLKLQFFFNPLRSSCENLTDLCLAGRNRFDSYQECSGACLNRDDYHARRRHQVVSRRHSR